ncbi:unnamed protein product [Echinostoma caproni]|uniref:GOLD domain-containing protein n=1 Tax=Echinostoma caproni TaxID=27848 RepID=A0A183ATM4_9TREM|nr:unnamed protein product [Echinostoma caproni]
MFISIFPIFVAVLLCSPALGLRFNLMAGEKKCLKEDSTGGIITKGQFSATKHDILSVSIAIHDSKSHLLYQRADFQNGSFSFSTEDFDLVDICFEVHKELRPNVLIWFVPFFLANAENLKPVEAELRRLEAITEEIVSSFVHMHNKSSHMRVTNGEYLVSKFCRILFTVFPVSLLV